MFSILIKAELIVSGFTHMDMELEARIWASRLGLRSQDWDLGLKTGIWASRLGLEGGYKGEGGGEGGGENSPYA